MSRFYLQNLFIIETSVNAICLKSKRFSANLNSFKIPGFGKHNPGFVGYKLIHLLVGDLLEGGTWFSQSPDHNEIGDLWKDSKCVCICSQSDQMKFETFGKEGETNMFNLLLKLCNCNCN